VNAAAVATGAMTAQSAREMLVDDADADRD